MNKLCTDFSQSKKLIELGIDIDTADLVVRLLPMTDGTTFAYVHNKNRWDTFPSITNGIAEDVPAWSLSALLGLMPNFNMFKRTIECRIETTNHLIDKACDPIDAAFEMVCFLKENNKI